MYNFITVFMIGLIIGSSAMVIYRYLLYRQEKELQNMIKQALIQAKRQQKIHFDAEVLFRKYMNGKVV